ncbi:MAG: UMP kinase, partial [Nitrospirae bacterium]|nr:UMP kinase [Nitrospirota bacterium]
MYKAQYKRVVVKISGEALMGDQEFGISSDMIRYVAEEIRSI